MVAKEHHSPSEIKIQISPNVVHKYSYSGVQHTSSLGTDHLTFSKEKYSDSQCCWKKYSDFGGGKQK